MTTTDVSAILERLGIIETKIDLAATQETRIRQLEAAMNKLVGALILLGAVNAGGIIMYVVNNPRT